MKPHKISTHLAYADNWYFHFFIGCLIELKFCNVSWNSISNWTWKFQPSILKNKKVLFLKKFFFGRCQYQNYWLNFLEGFDKTIPASLEKSTAVHRGCLIIIANEKSTFYHQFELVFLPTIFHKRGSDCYFEVLNGSRLELVQKLYYKWKTHQNAKIAKNTT